MISRGNTSRGAVRDRINPELITTTMTRFDSIVSDNPTTTKRNARDSRDAQQQGQDAKLPLSRSAKFTRTLLEDEPQWWK